MTEYLVRIVGMVVLSAAVDIILPSGKMFSFVRSMVALLLFFVVVQPIISFAKGDIDFLSVVQNAEETLCVDISDFEVKAIKQNIKAAVDFEFDVNSNVEIYFESENGVAKIGKVVIFIAKKEGELNSNDIEKMVGCVKTICGKDVEVIIYE